MYYNILYVSLLFSHPVLPFSTEPIIALLLFELPSWQTLSIILAGGGTSGEEKND